MATPRRVVVGSRTSPLSLSQNEEILRPLRTQFPESEFVVVPITTRGDRNKDAPLLSMDRGMFVKDIEASLLRGDIDLAVHSAKDLPATLPDGLTLAAVGQRKDARDALVNRWDQPFDKLPAGARLGTSSPRRTAQLLARRPDIDIRPIRGNVGTRLDKARGEDYDGAVLAAAGLERLGRQDEISEYLSPEWCTPDAGQGALAVEARSSDEQTLEMLSKVHHTISGITVLAERAFLAAIGGGCTVPVAAYAQLEDGNIHISTMAALPDGAQVYRSETDSDARDPEAAGRQAAQALIEAGARSILDGWSPP